MIEISLTVFGYEIFTLTIEREQAMRGEEKEKRKWRPCSSAPRASCPA